jgi:hypothetical protein
MMLWFVPAYASIPVLIATWALVELWAKSYDLPGAQCVAKASEVVIFSAATYAVTALAAAVAATPPKPATVLAWIGFLPPAFVLLWAVHDVDWRHVYVSASVGGALAIASRVNAISTKAIVPTGVVFLIVGMAMYRERESVRLRRYAGLLRSRCSCCGYKQKAVRELCALGDTGERTVTEYLRDTRESRAASEFERCRPTSG